MSKKPFRILQLIDSLNAGGSERMAVQLANVLCEHIDCSAIVCTREKGALELEISKEVLFSYLNRKSRLDLSAILRLNFFIKKNKIGIIHAHGTSFFIASIIKCLNPSLKLIWHDHFGYRYKTKIKDNLALYACSSIFSHIITINSKLAKWAKNHLNCKDISCIENFSIKTKSKHHNPVLLKGHKENFKIIHVANLRPEKDHITALKAIKILLDKAYKISYHCIGKITNNTKYCNDIEAYITENKLDTSVFLYDSQISIYDLLNQADLGLLSSTSEGFPVSLIEYANARLPVVVTDVGDCKKIVSNFGNIVEPQNEIQMAMAIEEYIQDPNWSESQAKKLNEKVDKTYNYKVILNKILDIYQTKIKAL